MGFGSLPQSFEQKGECAMNNSVLKLKLENGEDKNGAKLYATKSWKDVNIGISDEDLHGIATKMGALQSAEVASVIRVDCVALAAA